MKNTIKAKRTELNMTQLELANKVGVSRQTINYIETQRYVPSVIVASKIAEVLKEKSEVLFILGKEDWE